MIFIICDQMIKIKNGPLYQWDVNRSLEIDDKENKISEVHCCCEDDANALLLPFSRTDDKVVAFIPNILLQSSKKIYVFAVHKENNEVRTAEKKAFCVSERNKPSDYVYEETEVINYQTLRRELEEVLAGKADLDAKGKLKEEQLPGKLLSEEINKALAQAKESGEFKGEKGDTPAKGVDYFTEADKAEMVQMVIESLGGNPVFGYVDENNNIVVQGDLADGTYSVKYAMADGTAVDIGKLKIGSVAENLLPLSINADGTDFVGTHANGGDGYEYGYRVSRLTGELAATENLYCTGFMPVTADELIRIINISIYLRSPAYNLIAFYDSSKNYIDAKSISNMNSGVEIIDGGYAITMDEFEEKERIAFFRFSCGGITDESVVTAEKV